MFTREKREKRKRKDTPRPTIKHVQESTSLGYDDELLNVRDVIAMSR